LVKSKARLNLRINPRRLLFADVAGIDEAKAELEEVIDFLKGSQEIYKAGRKNS